MKILLPFFKDKKFSFAVLLLLFSCGLLYHFLVIHTARVQLDIESSQRVLFKIYWKYSQDAPWTERRVAPVRVEKGRATYAFRLADLGRVQALRIDPCERPATVRIHGLHITQQGLQPLHFSRQEQWAQLKPLGGVAQVKADQHGLQITSSSRDPQLELTIPALSSEPLWPQEACQLAALLATLAVVSLMLRSLIRRYRFVPLLVLAVGVLVLVMASISKYNEHPDEPVHVQAGTYYQQHVLPPAVGDPEIVKSYSLYGVSRLHSGEIAYLFAGKFSAMLSAFHLPNYLSLRLFNVALFFVLLLLALKLRDFRLLLVPLLISPQIWYIFSYFNSEAFALFIILLASYQMASEKSALNTLLRGELPLWRAMGTILILGFLVALLLLLKLNFYFYGLFLFLYFLWRIVFGLTVLSRQCVVCMLLVVVLGAGLFAGARWVDQSVNGFEKEQKMFAAREQYAREMFKPSTPLAKKHPYLQMKDRGVSLKRVIMGDRWGEKSFRSAFGVYGYTSISASFSYYDSVRYTGLLLLAVVVISVAIRGGRSGGSLMLVCAGTALALMGIALYHAWTVDFQAQGRYFLPIVGMLSVFFFHTERYLAKAPFAVLYTALFCLSFYNFLFVGLVGVGKISLGMM